MDTVNERLTALDRRLAELTEAIDGLSAALILGEVAHPRSPAAGWCSRHQQVHQSRRLQAVDGDAG